MKHEPNCPRHHSLHGCADEFACTCKRPGPDRLREITEKPLWLVWSNEHRAWWGPNSAGYRLKVEQAGRYTWKDALRCCESHTYSGEKIPPEVPMPSPELEAMLSAAVQK